MKAQPAVSLSVWNCCLFVPKTNIPMLNHRQSRPRKGMSDLVRHGVCIYFILFFHPTLYNKAVSIRDSCHFVHFSVPQVGSWVERVASSYLAALSRRHSPLHSDREGFWGKKNAALHVLISTYECREGSVRERGRRKRERGRKTSLCSQKRLGSKASLTGREGQINSFQFAFICLWTNTCGLLCLQHHRTPSLKKSHIC